MSEQSPERGDGRRGAGRSILSCAALLLPFQAKWVRDQARLKLAEKSRQIGWTWASAYGLVARKALRKARLDAWISSRDQYQAQLFIEDCKRFAEYLGVGALAQGEEALAAGVTGYVLQFANGRRLHSLSSNPDAQAGKRGDRILDEFALHRDARRLYAIAYPGITWGGSLEIFSTHRGSENFFNQLVQEARHGGNPKGFSLHRVTLQDALEQGFLSRLQQKLPADDPRQDMDEAAYYDFIRAGCPDEETFREEYCCEPSDDRGAFLSHDLISSCEYPPGESWQRFPPYSPQACLYLGVDVGRDHDLTVIWVGEQVEDVFYTRAVECLENETFDAQERALNEWLELPQTQRCCIDATGLGRQFAERTQQRFGSGRVEEICFTAPVKERLAYPVRAAFEARAVRVPAEPALRADLRAVKKETTAGGNVRFSAKRSGHGHADRFWALALALHARGGVADPGRACVLENASSTRMLAERRNRSLAG